jgi:hypothetical protein
MPFPEHSAYALLGVSPTATVPEIMQAYQRALRARRHPASLLTRAFNELRSPRRRLEHDLLSYGERDGADAVRALFAALPPERFLPDQTVQPLPADVLLLLDPAVVARDRRPVPEPDGELLASPRFAATPAVLPPLEFPA